MYEVDVQAFNDGRACSSARTDASVYSRWTRPLESLDVSSVLDGRVQSELRLRPSKIWTRPASAVDAPLGISTNASRRVRAASINSLDASSEELVCNWYCIISVT